MHVDFNKIKVCLVGSPGFQKDDFFKYMLSESVRREDRPFIENKGKFVLCHASSGHKHAIEEFFLDPSIMSKLTETKVREESGFNFPRMFVLVYTSPTFCGTWMHPGM